MILQHTLATAKERYMQMQQRLTKIENAMYGRTFSKSMPAN